MNVNAQQLNDNLIIYIYENFINPAKDGRLSEMFIPEELYPSIRTREDYTYICNRYHVIKRQEKITNILQDL